MSDGSSLRLSSAEYAKIARDTKALLERGERMRPAEKALIKPSVERGIKFFEDAAEWAKGRGQ